MPHRQSSASLHLIYCSTVQLNPAMGIGATHTLMHFVDLQIEV